MFILIYGNEMDRKRVEGYIKTQASLAFRKMLIRSAEEYEELIEVLGQEKADIVFVMMDNAAGMEGVNAVKKMSPQSSVIWFSNDKNFVAQSYRMGVDYFSVKPIEDKTMSLAIERCQRK